MDSVLVLALAAVALIGLAFAVAPERCLRVAHDDPDAPIPDKLWPYRLGGLAVMLLATAAEFAFILYQFAAQYSENR
jgi:hypothetical protein